MTVAGQMVTVRGGKLHGCGSRGQHLMIQIPTLCAAAYLYGRDPVPRVACEVIVIYA
jgi:hypothetical protein